MGEPSSAHAWMQKCTFTHPVSQKKMSYLMNKPGSWDDANSFGVGCFVGHSAHAKGSFAELAVSSRAALQVCNLRSHASHPIHQKALVALGKAALGEREAEQGDTDMANVITGAISGLSDAVPRLDRWVQALQLVKQCSAYEQFPELVPSQAVGSSLEPGGDSGAKMARKLIFCMAEALAQTERRVLRKAVASSIAIDKTGDSMILYIRVLVKQGLYDFLGGIAGQTVGDVPAVAAALRQMLRDLCTVPVGHRKEGDNIYRHAEDEFDEDSLLADCLKLRTSSFFSLSNS